MSANHLVVCFSHDERSVCLNLDGAKRWFLVEETAYGVRVMVDGREYRIVI